MHAFFRQLSAEQKKTAHKKIWLVPSAFLLFQTLWWTFQMSHASQQDFQTGYLMSFYHFPIMNTLLLPLMIAVIASRLCDMEIKGDTLKSLYTLQHPSSFFNFKYLNGLKYLLFFTAGQGILLVISGKLCNFTDPFPPSMFALHLTSTFAVSAVLLLIQQTLSLLSDNQMMPLVVGLSGCFAGLFSMFFPQKISLLILWYYYGAFPTVWMDWNRESKITHFYKQPFPAKRFFLFLLAGILIYFICRTITVKKER